VESVHALFAYQKELIDIWLEAFRRTPLLMNFDEQQALTYGTEHGAVAAGLSRGHADEFHNAYFPAEMLEIYPQQIVRAEFRSLAAQTCIAGSLYTVAGCRRRLRRRLHPGPSAALACEHREHKSSPIRGVEERFDSFRRDRVRFICGGWNTEDCKRRLDDADSYVG